MGPASELPASALNVSLISMVIIELWHLGGVEEYLIFQLEDPS